MKHYFLLTFVLTFAQSVYASDFKYSCQTADQAWPLELSYSEARGYEGSLGTINESYYLVCWKVEKAVECANRTENAYFGRLTFEGASSNPERPHQLKAEYFVNFGESQTRMYECSYSAR